MYIYIYRDIHTHMLCVYVCMYACMCTDLYYCYGYMDHDLDNNTYGIVAAPCSFRGDHWLLLL